MGLAGLPSLGRAGQSAGGNAAAGAGCEAAAARRFLRSAFNSFTVGWRDRVVAGQGLLW